MAVAEPFLTRPRRRGASILAGALGTLLVLGAFAYCTRSFWADTLRSYAIGRVYDAGRNFGKFLPEPDEVEILALGGSVPKGTLNSFATDFGDQFGTVNQATVRDAEAHELAGLWRATTFNSFLADNCHLPIYALRFRSKGLLISEVSICWKCGTWMMPIGGMGRSEFGFDPRSEPAQQLLAGLTRHAPHPQTLPSRIEGSRP